MHFNPIWQGQNLSQLYADFGKNGNVYLNIDAESKITDDGLCNLTGSVEFSINKKMRSRLLDEFIAIPTERLKAQLGVTQDMLQSDGSSGTFSIPIYDWKGSKAEAHEYCLGLFIRMLYAFKDLMKADILHTHNRLFYHNMCSA